MEREREREEQREREGDKGEREERLTPTVRYGKHFYGPYILIS